jgi:hypothetical protein
MVAFTAEDFLLIRESAARSDIDHAATILTRAFPAEPADELRRLPLGRRHARLAAVHRDLFGPRLEAYAECPQCGERLEFALDTTMFRPPLEERAGEYTFDDDGHVIRFRLLDGTDLHAAANCSSVSDARALLLERCVLDARHGDEPVAAGALPANVVEHLAQRLEECDPDAVTLLDMRCPACGQQWQIAVDIASFLQSEIELRARRILREIHALARGYGWREADILAMSARRRRDYLELLFE